ncbi:hypothetical protein [Algoriphagus formosus]|uniref:hypothetical protein n=1 Tax=Algoriphagus formosus TaxID=2007308 RepID=UPI0012FD8FEA|nr:hypothetical protein [Algoriphagus formosus]
MSFFKNVFTLGGYGRMENELQKFEERRLVFLTLVKEFEGSLKSQKAAFKILKNQRNKAEKNIFLFKTILLLIKNKIKDNPADVIQDVMQIKGGANVPTKVRRAKTDIPQFDLSKFSEDFFLTTSKNLNMLGKIKDPKKEDFIITAVATAVSAITNSIGGIIKLNQEVNNKRKEINFNTQLLFKTASEISNYFPILYSDTLRANEIARTLIKANETFSIQYLDIINNVFHENEFVLFKKFVLNQKFQISDDVVDKIIFLGSICSEYNKISQTKLYES